MLPQIGEQQNGCRIHRIPAQFHPIPEVYHTQTGLPAWLHPTWTPSRFPTVVYLSVRRPYGYWDSSGLSPDSLNALFTSVPHGT